MFAKQRRAKGDHTIEECNHTVNGVPIHYHPLRATEGKPTVKIVTGLKSEDHIIPSREPLEVPGILGAKDFARLKKQAEVLTQEEKNAMLEEAEARKKQQHIESDKRKEMLRKMQNKAPEKGSILDEVEAEATKKNQYMLNRARELRQEQEDEVKTLNGIILASKCLAIREAQIAEKKLIAKELEDEDHRLDMMMEQQRQRDLLKDKEKQRQVEEMNHQFVNKVKEQLKVNEIQQLIEREKREEEARNSNKLLIAFQQQQLDEIAERKRIQAQTREDLRVANESAEKYRRMKEDEERLLDLRLRQFIEQKEKDEQERALQAAIVKECKDSDIQRLGQKVREAELLAIQREEMNVFRLHEEAEREWRNKEKAKALKRKEDIEKLRVERERQINDIREAQALEIARDQEQFTKNAKEQRKEYERELEKRQEERLRAEKNRRDLLKQVNFKEKERIEQRRLAMEEGEAMRLENEMRKVELLETLDRKIAALSESSIPEKTLQDIRRQAEKKVKATIM